MLQDTFADKATERKILSLLITCPSKGCQWTGELRSKDVIISSNRMCIRGLLLTPNSKHNPLYSLGETLHNRFSYRRLNYCPKKSIHL